MRPMPDLVVDGHIFLLVDLENIASYDAWTIILQDYRFRKDRSCKQRKKKKGYSLHNEIFIILETL